MVEVSLWFSLTLLFDTPPPYLLYSSTFICDFHRIPIFEKYFLFFYTSFHTYFKNVLYMFKLCKVIILSLLYVHSQINKIRIICSRLPLFPSFLVERMVSLLKAAFVFFSISRLYFDWLKNDRLIKRSMFFFFGNKQNKGNILIEEKAVERSLGLLSFLPFFLITAA